MNLFAANQSSDTSGERTRPLADRMRPRSLEEFVGQEHLIAPGKPLRAQIERDDISSLIFWGPPGTGKTTLAKIIARMTRADFIEFSAVLSGIKEIKQVMADAERARQYGTRTTVFIDEIHRFNKAQQDAFLPYVESGSIRLIGATTENPSFEIISALLSRSRVYVLNPLTEEQVVVLLGRALADNERGLGEMHLSASDDQLRRIAAYSSGDARSAYNVLEVAAALATSTRSSETPNQAARHQGSKSEGGAVSSETAMHEITPEIIQDALQKRILLYDKTGEEHYNLISALHKSVRNSDPVLHNIHFYQNDESLFNIAQPTANQVNKQKLEKAGMVYAECDVHGWMQGHVAVVDIAHQGRRRGCEYCHVAGEETHHRRIAALKRNVLHRRLRHHLEEVFAGDVRSRTDAGGSHEDRPGLCRFDQVGQGLDWRFHAG